MKLKNILGAGIIAASTLAAAPVMAAGGPCPAGSAKAGNNYVNSIAECNIKEDNSLMPTINTIINVVLGVLGIVAVVIIVLGGVQYTTSAGDPGKVKKAKDTILYGIIGLIIALLAFAIVNFVLSSVFGA
jgi:hypothetical protein